MMSFIAGLRSDMKVLKPKLESGLSQILALFGEHFVKVLSIVRRIPRSSCNTICN